MPFQIGRKRMTWNGDYINVDRKQVFIQPVYLSQQSFDTIAPYGIPYLLAYNQTQPGIRKAIYYHIENNLCILKYLPFLKNPFKLLL